MIIGLVGRVSVRETWVQSLVTSYQRLWKWYLIPPCLTLSNIRNVSRLNWSNLGKGVAPSPTPRCSSYWKESLLVALDYSCQFIYNLWSAVNFQESSNNAKKVLWPPKKDQKLSLYEDIAQSAGAVEYTDCISAEG